MTSIDRTRATSRTSMLRDLDTLIGSCVVATDGEVGRVHSLLFDDDSWTVAYLVIAEGKLAGRRDLALPLAVAGQLRCGDRSLGIQCTKGQVLNCREVIPGRWDKHRLPGTARNGSSILGRWLNRAYSNESIMLHGPAHAARTMMNLRLRSTKELLSYRLWNSDGEVGRLHGFFVDDQSWRLKYLVARTGDWARRRIVRIPTCSIESISDKDRRINLNDLRDGN